MTNSLSVTRLNKSPNGAPIRIVVEVATSGSPQEFIFNGSHILVGRHQRADLRLDSSEISNRQLYLQWGFGGLFGVNLSNRVSTNWNGAALASGWIDEQTVVTIGPYTLRFPELRRVEQTPSGEPANPLASGSWPGPPVLLELQRGKSSSQSATIDRVLTLVGNVGICKLRMNSSRVSSVHCALVRSSEGLRVVDLVSREGVRINGNCVQDELLREGDQLDLGGRQLVVRYSDANQPLPASERSAEKDDGESFGPTEIAVAGRAFAPATTGEANADGSSMGQISEFFAVPPQSAEQFQAMMTTLMQAFGMMYSEHRKFVQDEMDRLDTLIRALAERPQPPVDPEKTAKPVPNAPAPDLSIPLPPLGDSKAADQIHVWLQQRIEELGEKRASFWERMAGLVRTKPYEAPRG